MSAEMTRGQELEKMEKMGGCMAGLLQIFDRHQTLSGKRFYSAKHLPPSPVADTSSESEKSSPALPSPAMYRELSELKQPYPVVASSPERLKKSSPAMYRELSEPKQPYPVVASSPERLKKSSSAELRSLQVPAVAGLPAKTPLPLPIWELKEGTRSSWKFCKEAPRLSLDSRAIIDAKGGLHPKEIRTAASILSSTNRFDSTTSDANNETQQHRSPSVIARLMGLEPLTKSPSTETEKKPELQRSASESRVSRDLFHSRFMSEGTNFYSNAAENNAVKEELLLPGHCGGDPRDYLVKDGEPNGDCLNSPSPWRAPHHRKSFFDSGDFFPEPKQTVAFYREVDNRFTMKGIDEPAKDLETLKQILEALQLKGLLHSRKLPEQNKFSHRNFVYDLSPASGIKSSRLSNSTPINRRMANHYSPSSGLNQTFGGVPQHYSMSGVNSPAVSPRREKNVRGLTQSDRTASPTSSTRIDENAIGRRTNSLAKPKTLSFETPRRKSESFDNRRTSPVHSPKLNPRRPGSDPTANNSLPRCKKATADIHHREDESSSISGCSITTSTDTDRSRTEEYKEYKEGRTLLERCDKGRTLLERCDKLLYSIAEITATDPQPSPVSVLDPSFYKDESLSPSPVTKRRNIDFKDHSGELEDELWSFGASKLQNPPDDYDYDFIYISDILRACHYLPGGSDVFLALEKQLYLRGDDTSKVSRLRRMLVFDTINELIGRKSRLPPWKSVCLNISHPSVCDFWPEFLRIREYETGKDLFECICNVMKKDLCDDSITGWLDFPLEMSEAILDIERLVFKDLVSETIRDFATSSASRRKKLVF